jgi:hypothetical protein
MAEEQTARAQAVQEKYNDMLLAKAHVQGTAVGLAKEDGEYTGEIAVVVMVDVKLPLSQLDPEDVVPTRLDGVRVDVQEMGIFTAQ